MTLFSVHMQNIFSAKHILALFITILHVKNILDIILHNKQKFISKF